MGEEDCGAIDMDTCPCIVEAVSGPATTYSTLISSGTVGPM